MKGGSGGLQTNNSLDSKMIKISCFSADPGEDHGKVDILISKWCGRGKDLVSFNEERASWWGRENLHRVKANRSGHWRKSRSNPFLRGT